MSALRRLSLVVMGLFMQLLPSLAVGAAMDWYGEHEEGWFWYREFYPEEVEEEAIPWAPPSASFPEPPPSPPPLSAEWFRENFEKYQKRAIDDPTPENVAAYLYIQRVMLDKSQRFAEQVRRVVQMDPLLDQSTRRPLASYGGAQFSREALAAQKSLLAKIADRAGIFFFFQSGCGHCEVQAPVLKSLQERYGFVVFAVSVDGQPLRNNLFPDYAVDRGQARRLKVIQTPAMFLGRPATGDVLPLGQSVMSRDQLEQRILSAAAQAGWITPEEYNRTRGFNANLALDLRPGMVPEDLGEEELLAHIRRLYAERAQVLGGGSEEELPANNDNPSPPHRWESCEECGFKAWEGFHGAR